jgi:hypothetical protein
MNPTVYSIERGKVIVTVKTCGGALGAALSLYPEIRKGVSWKETERNKIGRAIVTVVTTAKGEEITVKEIDIPLAWVKWV